jgi:hypothetical protein
VSSHNYAAPHYGNTYITNNRTIIENNYRYDSAHYEPHVANFYGVDQSAWGGHMRYGVVAAPGVSVSFGFGFYAYTPYYAPVVASPWYYYPGVPAYVPQSRVVILSDYNCDWGYGNAYVYQPGVAYDSYGYAKVNQAVDSIVDVYQNSDSGAVGKLLDPNQMVAVFSEGNYEYSLNSDDFQQTMSDNIQATQTQSFTITSVRHHSGHLTVAATHVFTVQDGSTETVYQLYHLQREGNNFVITDFMTSHNPYNINPHSNF